jgi:hypothetical protein
MSRVAMKNSSSLKTIEYSVDHAKEARTLDA